MMMSCDVDDEEEYGLSYPIIHEEEFGIWMLQGVEKIMRYSEGPPTI
jgi:hypothetical protein